MQPRRSARQTGYVLAALATLLPGCATNGVVPASLQMQLDRSLTFAQLKDSPDSYRSRLILVGGEVLEAKLLKQGTRLVILQLPLHDSQEPGLDRTASQGRFLAIQKEFLDPATLPEGTRVTIVGEVTGATTLPLDETDYVYPTLEIKHLKVWSGLIASQDRYSPAMSSYWSPYWGPYDGPYWGGAYGYWGIPYWGAVGNRCGSPCIYWQEGRRAPSQAPARFRRAKRRH